MSRIHEALKRAERERGRADPPVARVQISAFDPIPEEAEVPSSFTPLTLESLQARSSKLTWNPDPHAQLTEQLDGDSPGAEEFRSLRSFLYLARQQRRLQRILISSPLPREGKSFTALNLAHAIARQPEHGALLIDSDLRLPRLHAALGTNSTPGLTEYLSSEADEFSILQRGLIENLFFIPAGKSPSDPSELIGNGRLKLLLDRLTPAVDWIILDSPPVLPVSDAKLLAELCDAVILVVQAGSTPYDLARKACQQFRDKQVLAVVLNRAAPNPAYSSYYHYNREDGRNHNGTG